MKLRIAIVVHGRFYAFDLAKSLLACGHDVHLFTNYPKWAVAQFGFPVNRVNGFWIHGIASRVCGRLRESLGSAYPEPWLHESFGHRVAKTVTRSQWDVVCCFSGIATELFEALKGGPTSLWLIRASSHIRVQARILEEEQRRAGVTIDRPSPWMIAREEHEYSIADMILVPSGFAQESFAGSEAAQKVCMIPLGVSLKDFRLPREKLEARVSRIAEGAKLRVLYVGTKSYRKGLLDLAEIARRAASRFEMRWVGPTESGALPLINNLKNKVEVLPAVPEAQLREVYAWGDLFIFTTIEDGFAMVLAQAHANGLPILATTNCAAPDFVRERETGWILPIRSPAAFVEKLEWCDNHRAELAEMIGRIGQDFCSRTWDDVARDHEEVMARQVAERSAMKETANVR